jgi:hypothetical protein
MVALDEPTGEPAVEGLVHLEVAWFPRLVGESTGRDHGDADIRGPAPRHDLAQHLAQVVARSEEGMGGTVQLDT